MLGTQNTDRVHPTILRARPEPAHSSPLPVPTYLAHPCPLALRRAPVSRLVVFPIFDGMFDVLSLRSQQKANHRYAAFFTVMFTRIPASASMFTSESRLNS